ncbi:uncharacterized protein LOC112637886 [Camponotus floridanus]|uniref:uncharacterized protein LOC112637886 n=1 Tax=Camponotus floridanus TaxID=104421 RepID=UPI000DC672B7|nr:uncharacterized protein LOC112637886 [Camponotus floridanus]
MAWRNRLRCYICDGAFLPAQMSRIDGDENAARREIAIVRRDSFNRPVLEITNRTRLCINCNRSVLDELRIIEHDPTCLRLNVLTQTANRTCVICNVEDVPKVSADCRVNVFILCNIYIPENVRSCQHHLDDRGFFLEPLLCGLQFINRPYVLKGPQLAIFLQGLRNVAVNKRRFVDENSLTDSEFSSFSPVTKEQFLELFNYCDRVTCNGGYRYVLKKDLLMFLCKLRQGLSDDFLQVIFEYSSRQATSMAISTVRQSLMQRFVPENIGLNSVTRENYIARHVPEFVNELYNANPNIPRVIAAIDGTYSYIPKCSNFRTLRQSFSIHKSRHLLKPVLIVALDGYIFDIQGPYFSDSRNNDAAILENEFERDAERMREWFRDGDILIVDRGYRDATELLARLGIIWKMPARLQQGRNQITTEEANDSRLVTKTRWIVEARNGHIKSIFKFFQQIIPIPHLLNLGDFYRIAGAIINRYRSVIEMQGTNAELARQMLERAKTPNIIQALVEVDNLHTRNAQRWVRLDVQQILDFPILDLEYLKDLTVGIYQINLAPSYVQDKLQREGQEEFHVEMMRNVQRLPQPGLMRVRIFSRFRNATKYQLWIKYRHNNDQEPADAVDELIQGYYCTCKSGARTLGTCAHIASVLWYVGYAQHQQNIKYP